MVLENRIEKEFTWKDGLKTVTYVCIGLALTFPITTYLHNTCIGEREKLELSDDRDFEKSLCNFFHPIPYKKN